MAERPAFIDQLRAQWDEGKFVCVGLDSDFLRLPVSLASNRQANCFASRFNTLRFNQAIVDATHDLVLAYKPNIAFYEDDPEGELVLESTVDYIHDQYPHISVIGDVKRADIANTNAGYARMAFERYGFDAITTNPYFGHDTYDPFLQYPGKGLLVLCKTSNPGAAFYQDTPVDLEIYDYLQKRDRTPLSHAEYDLAERAAALYKLELRDILTADEPSLLPLYQLVALRTATLARGNPNVGLVVGATHSESFEPVRILAPDLPILIPGIGKQGGDLEKTLKYASDSKGQGMIINSSSGIIFASSGEDFAEAARATTLKLHNQITGLRRNI